MPPGSPSRASRFLFVTADLPRDTGSGGQIVSYRLLRAYSELGSVDVAALAAPNAAPAPELRERARRIGIIRMPHFESSAAPRRNAYIFARSIVQGVPFRVLKFQSRALRRLVAGWARDEGYDAVHCDHLSTAPYRDLVPGTPAVLAEHNVEWEQFAQLAERKRNPLVRQALLTDSRRTSFWEARALGRFDHVLTLSNEDRQALAAERPDLEARISVWPVPVEPWPPVERVGGPPTFLALGSLRSAGRADGVRWFLEAVWPDARRRLPDARLEIVGGSPPADIRRRDGSEGIAVRGFVENLGPILARVDACVIPLFVGAGIRVKLLELIGRGIPCIGTELAFRGLGLLDGCVQASSANRWISALTAVTESDRSRREARRGAARLRAERSPERAIDSLRALVERLAG